MTASTLFWIDSIAFSGYNGIFAHAGTAYSRVLPMRLIYTLTMSVLGTLARKEHPRVYLPSVQRRENIMQEIRQGLRA